MLDLLLLYGDARKFICFHVRFRSPGTGCIIKNALGCLPRAKIFSAVPPVFRVWLCTSSVLILLLGPLLEGYFYTLFMKARIDRFLSGFHGDVYSSLSLHLIFGCCLLVIIIPLNYGGCQPGFRIFGLIFRWSMCIYMFFQNCGRLLFWK